MEKVTRRGGLGELYELLGEFSPRWFALQECGGCPPPRSGLYSEGCLRGFCLPGARRGQRVPGCRDAGMSCARWRHGGAGCRRIARASPPAPSQRLLPGSGTAGQADAALDPRAPQLEPGAQGSQGAALAGTAGSRASLARPFPGPFPALSRPDPPGNQPSWPQPSTQKEGLGFPCLKLTGIFSLASGGLEDYATGTLHQPESILLRSLWGRLEKGGLLLGDRGFCSSAALGARSRRGIDAVLRLHQARKVGFREGRRLGGADRLVGLEEAGATPRGVAWAGVGGSARKPFGETEPAPGRPARLAPAGGLPW